ncbi:MAG: hypothetical protein ACRD4F_12220, partial [Candidatus Angelobacter sp.]
MLPAQDFQYSMRCPLFSFKSSIPAVPAPTCVTPAAPCTLFARHFQFFYAPALRLMALSVAGARILASQHSMRREEMNFKSINTGFRRIVLFGLAIMMTLALSPAASFAASKPTQKISQADFSRT